jgi:hypothetical protein
MSWTARLTLVADPDPAAIATCKLQKIRPRSQTEICSCSLLE